MPYNSLNGSGGTMYIPPVTHPAENHSNRMQVTIFDGNQHPRTVRLDSFGRDIITFGRNATNDIVLNSPLVSREHGRFRRSGDCWMIEDREVFDKEPSKNGILYNNTFITSRPVSDGDFIRIDRRNETRPEGVLLIFSLPDTKNRWSTIQMEGRNRLTIGRDQGCDIILPHISVSRQHAFITVENDGCYITDNNSTNGIVVNNRRVEGKQRLHEKDVIVITNSKLVFSSSMISYCCYRNGISVDASHVTITRGKGNKSFVTGNDISLGIRPGELVAIIGGSGAGKSTILNCMCGYLPPAHGDVYINGVSLYENFDALKKMIGYVPQSDIVYDNLTLYDMLSYTAKLRLPKDVSEQECKAAIDRAIELVELTEKRDSFIKALSGGQRKRASIAVELLSDPKLLFLDEPASGLDPGTERNLMHSLRTMADSGKTVILVTHSTLQLSLCDKIVFMGKGGNLCFFGSLQEALSFFRVTDVVDIYNMINDQAPYWRERFNKINRDAGKDVESKEMTVSSKSEKKPQLPVLCARYLKLVINDRQRLLLLLLQAPLLALLISLVATGKQYDQYEITKSLLFSLSCSAFWVGMLNAIQEICKERNITKREYMTGLSLNAYIVSKISVLGLMCLIQSALIVLVFALTVGLPEEGLMMPSMLELLITTFLTAVASTAMGLFVSSLFTNADRAMTVAPILLMPQILFSGLIFKLDGATEVISWFAVCRWSMECYGTTANLNVLDLKMQQEKPELAGMLQHEPEAFFDFTNEHMLKSWLILIAFTFVFLLLARIVLSSIRKEKE